MSRPGVSIVVPFLGDGDEARALLRMLERVDAADADELIVADNTTEGVVGPLAAPGVSVVAAGDERSASYARNRGAAAATGEWLLFVDADCVPERDLLETYFREPIDERCAIVAGEVRGLAGQASFLARWARARRGLWVRHHLTWGPHPAGVTANLLVRRSAFEVLGGFRIGGGGDLDLCWRAQEAGWGFEYRPGALVRHRDRERLRELAGQAVAYGGHQRRLRDLHGPAVPRVTVLAPLARSLAGALVWTVRGQPERARFKLLDGYWGALQWWGWLTHGAGARRAD